MLCVLCCGAWAQAYPDKTVRIVEPVGPGAAPDGYPLFHANIKDANIKAE